MMQARFQPELYAIDFGTTNSLLAAAGKSGVHPPIELDDAAPDPTIMRTVLYFPSAERCLYGARAIAEYSASGMQGRLIRSIKKHLPSRSFIGTYIEDRPMNLEDLIGAFLGEMRSRANRFFDADVRRAVLGRPARFAPAPEDDELAQYRLERAARVAGFTEVSFCPEPVAAAREFRTTLREPKLVLVGDFGGGTSDFTVMRMRGDRYDASDVLAIGAVSVAGDALDACIMRSHVSRHFGADVRYKVPMGSNVLQMPPALMEKLCSPADASILQMNDALPFLRNVQAWSLGPDDSRRIEQLVTFVEDRLGFEVFEVIERVKRELSQSASATLEFEYPTIDIVESIARQAFEQSTEKRTEAILAELDATLQRAGVAHHEIEIVCCTGGTARVPAIADGLAKRFGRDKLTDFQNFHSVIHGLAEHAAALI
jgi:hypothetical chaperone protein